MIDVIEQAKKQKVTICCGGGIDSTALIHWYLDRDYLVHGAHFDYGQPACDGERRSLKKISQFYKIRISFCKIQPVIPVSRSGEYFGRNAIIILSALNISKQSEGLISIGIHANTDFFDCTKGFVSQMQNLLDGYSGGTIVIDTPFISFGKEDIIFYSRKNNVPIYLTYSCQQNSDNPCGRCKSCLERKAYGID